MSMPSTFKRHELKYKLTISEYRSLLNIMKNYMIMDEYGRHKISNIYFDTDDYRIIRHSIEKPKYKEKLRLRVYGEPNEDSIAFIELKKKFNGVVYKRRVASSKNDALSYFNDEHPNDNGCQIRKEVNYFRKCYKGIIPKVYLSYEREAFSCKDDEHFRMTFDFKIKMRDNDISFYDSDSDNKVLGDDYVLLEVKTVTGLPFWLLDFLNKNNIFSTSFSKYGTAYKNYIFPKFLNSVGGTI